MKIKLYIVGNQISVANVTKEFADGMFCCFPTRLVSVPTPHKTKPRLQKILDSINTSKNVKIFASFDKAYEYAIKNTKSLPAINTKSSYYSQPEYTIPVKSSAIVEASVFVKNYNQKNVVLSDVEFKSASLLDCFHYNENEFKIFLKSSKNLVSNMLNIYKKKFFDENSYEKVKEMVDEKTMLCFHWACHKDKSTDWSIIPQEITCLKINPYINSSYKILPNYKYS